MKLNEHIIGSNAGTGEWYVDTLDNSFATKPQAEWFAMSGESVSEFDAPKELRMAQANAEFVAKIIAANKKVWDGIQELTTLQAQWTALDYTNNLIDPKYPVADLSAVVFTAADAIKVVLAAGNATNMAKLL